MKLKFINSEGVKVVPEEQHISIRVCNVWLCHSDEKAKLKVCSFSHLFSSFSLFWKLYLFLALKILQNINFSIYHAALNCISYINFLHSRHTYTHKTVILYSSCKFNTYIHIKHKLLCFPLNLHVFYAISY